MHRDKRAGIRVVSHVVDSRDAESLKHLAHGLDGASEDVALLGSRDERTARLVFAERRMRRAI